ncbi:MAG: extracellular solute-binding protein family 5 [Thermomicrobiales bacterium]|nr:extracellular solute-binding protein family 5 [Thermomicrobiales bacterium]
MDTRVTVHELLAGYRAGRLSRRDLLIKSAALGISATALGQLLAREAVAATLAQEEPVAGGTLREGYDLDFSKLDPVNTDWYDPAFHALYDSLMIDAPDGTLQPNLAESWEVSEDGKSVTFVLREGTLFHSGRPVTAEAVKEVYEAVMDPANASPLASLFTPVESIEATDERTIVLGMAHPYYEVVNVVKTGFWAIANIETRNELAEQYGQSGVDGTGPFLFGEWVPGSHVSVTRWEDYPGSNVPYFSNKGKAYLDGIRWDAILEAAQRAVRIENAELDTLRNPALQDVARLETNPDLSVSTFSEPSGYILNTNFERTDLDFHEQSMRQAISHAIDREAIVTVLLAGLGSPLYGPITPADVFYDPGVEEFNQFDLELARSMVSELGWTPGDDGIRTKNGVRHAFTLTVRTESFIRDLASVLQASLAELGMEVTIEALDVGAYFDKLTTGADSSLFYYLWPVPIDVVSLFVSSGTIPAPNWSRAKLPDVDAALDAWKQAANAEELAEAGNQFQLAIAEQLPTIPLVVQNSTWVSRPNVHGWLPHQYDIYPHYNDVWLSQ